MNEKTFERDAQTLRVMTQMYCANHHGTNCKSVGGDRGSNTGDDLLCEQCSAVLAYSLERTARCPHEHKGNCKECPIHCYKPDMRAAIKEIMSYAGPRMLYAHPLLALRYVARKIKGVLQ
mgnify:FL=1